MSQTEPVEFLAAEFADIAERDAQSGLRLLLHRAVSLHASDIFLLANEHETVCCVRRMGMLQKLAVLSKEQGRSWLSHVKAMSEMDIAEHRRPTEGRWLFLDEGRTFDLRVNCIPTLYGQDLAMRLLDRSYGLRNLDSLGLSHHDLGRLTALLASPSGLILVSGPTGTGKTTTLYSCLQRLNDGRRKINTLEDPIEYSVDGVRQSAVNLKIGVDFPELLRNILRQAPDVIMVGEIRDQETAITCVRAANSGHLVLATLHAPVAASAVQSMLALGVNPYFLSAGLLGIVSQRLMRCLCEKCRAGFDISDAPGMFDDVRPLLAPGEGHVIYGPRGCEACHHEGYSGRTGVFEIITMNRELRDLIAAGKPSQDIERAAIAAGMIEFRRAALLKVAHGVTSLEEVMRSVPAAQLGLE